MSVNGPMYIETDTEQTTRDIDSVTAKDRTEGITYRQRLSTEKAKSDIRLAKGHRDTNEQLL